MNETTPPLQAAAHSLLSPAVGPVLPSLLRMDLALQAQARAQRGGSDAVGPCFPATVFDYHAELAATRIDAPAQGEALDSEVARFFRGAVRPHASNMLFNMQPQPDPDVAAAAALALMHNSNCLMDAFGGEALLVEQKVARALGRWIGWDDALGISCSGGKLTLFYALSNAIGRLWPQMRVHGVGADVQVLCSEGAHYCMEHVASLVGIGSGNCVRVRAGATGGMCPEALAAALRSAHAAGRKVAAIVCCAGTTIGFACDDTADIVATVDAFVAECRPAQRPLLHLDSVIGWLYFTCLDEASAAAVPPEQAPAGARARVAQVLARLSAVRGFDSFSADFHKNGLAPYASSFFVARDGGFMDALGSGHYHYSPDDFRAGQFRAYRYTVENSRAGNGTLAAWASLNKYGRSGLADYLMSLQQARDELEQAVAAHGQFRVVNRSSGGWEVVFTIEFPPALCQGAASLAGVSMAFATWCWARVRAGEDLPLFSIVPGFRDTPQSPVCDNAFLLYPMRPLGAAAWQQVLRQIADMRDQFIRGFPGQSCAAEAARAEKPVR